MRNYFVYILASRSRVLYAGVTNDLVRRVWQHKTSQIAGFTTRYRIDRLVHFEETSDVTAAIVREKQIKAWSRAKKVALTESANPMWDDLSNGWYDRELLAKQIPRCARNDR
jgi:putative endonuclease